MIGLSGLTFRYLGKDNNGIHWPSESKADCSGVNGFWSIPDALINECSFSWAQKETSRPRLLR